MERRSLDPMAMEAEAQEYYANMVKLIRAQRASGPQSPYPYNFKVTLSIPDYVKKYNATLLGNPWSIEEALAGKVVKILHTSPKGRLFCYHICDGGVTVRVMANVFDSRLHQTDFTQLHSSVKLGDVVGVIGRLGNKITGEVTIYCTRFAVLSRCLHTLPPQKGDQLDTPKVALRVGENASIVTTTNHRAGKFEAKLYDKMVLEGRKNASIVRTTDHGAGKFEAKLYDKVVLENTPKALAFNLDGKSFTSGCKIASF